MYGEYGYVGKKICVLSVGMCVCKCMCVRMHAHTPQTARDRMSKAQSWMVAQLLMISPVTQLQDSLSPGHGHLFQEQRHLTQAESVRFALLAI